MITSAFHIDIGTVTWDIDASAINRIGLVMSMGALQLKNDITPQEVQIKSLVSTYQKMSVTLFDDTVDGFNIADILEAEIATNGQVDATMTIALEGTPSTYVFKFIIKQGDIAENTTAGTVTITMSFYYDESVLCSDVFALLASPKVYRVASNSYDGYSVRAFMTQALKSIFDNTFGLLFYPALTGLPSQYNAETYGDPVTLSTSRDVLMVDMDNVAFGAEPDQFFAGTGTMSATNGSALVEFSETVAGIIPVGSQLFGITGATIPAGTVFIGTVASFPNPDEITLTATSSVSFNGPFLYASTVGPTDFPAIQTMAQLAGTEGGIFGSAFSQNYYINRLRTHADIEVTISDVNIDDISVKNTYQFLQTTAVAQLVNGGVTGTASFGEWPTSGGFVRKLPNLRPTISQNSLNPNASKSLSISIPLGYPMLNKGQYDISEDWWAGDSPISIDQTIEGAICTAGRSSYEKALSADGDTMRIELVVNKVDLVKPWNVVKFSASADIPTRVTGKSFRVSSVDYDFYNNRAKLTLYQI